MRRLGDITGDMEPLILEMVDEHDMQWGEVLSLVHGYLQVHCPGAREEYTDGGFPIFQYNAEGRRPRKMPNRNPRRT